MSTSRERRDAARSAHRESVKIKQDAATLAHIREEGFGRVVVQPATKMRRVWMSTGDCKKWIDEPLKDINRWTPPTERNPMDTRVYLDRIAAKKNRK